ncbi:MAG: prepilin-type N-terminal cleavage/methylation domain-containing protein [Planctomycetales bacterium]|nr:prepilin-type N-terminal cleavage/methylation domain-containing protein [Planctomycetales bacterium]
MKTRTRLPHGFTLVEVLVVIAIIGLLVGLLVPAIGMVSKSIREKAIAMEVTTLSDAINKYEQKYNDLPPDGASLPILQRHLLKAFPQMAASELALLTTDVFPGTSTPLVNNFGNGSAIGVMDPAEAIVFFLGGFSEDPQFPFSGVGGPIYITDGNGVQQTSGSITPANRGSVQYNPDRNNPLYDFKQGQMTLDVIGGITASTDEGELLGNPAVNDLLPAYRPSGQRAPYVYFDHRTYAFPVGSATFYNHYTLADHGACRPYRSDDINTKVPVTPANANAYYRFMAEKSFQLISAGLDDSYGGIPWNGIGGGPVFYRFPSGRSIDFGPVPNGAPLEGEFTNYADTSGISTQNDNAASFADSILGDSLAN